MDLCRDDPIYILILAILYICRPTWSQITGSCSYSYYISPGETYRLNSPRFPKYYPPGIDCSWTMSTRNGYRVVLACNTVELPSTGRNCMDYLIVSTTGDLRDGRAYCTDLIAFGSIIKMQLISLEWGWGGVFGCDISAEKIPVNETNQVENCACGWSFSARIVGGNETNINEFPSMALIVYVPLRTQWCGATIIARTVALTAGHCFQADDSPSNYGLLVGEHDTSTGMETNATKLLKVSAIIVHDSYLPTQDGNDIALLVTATDIIYSSRVGPACLPVKISKADIVRKDVIVTGWGTDMFGGQQSPTLQKVTLQIIPDPSCIDTYGDKFKPAKHLCTYAFGKDACQFDSGGPLYYYYHLSNQYIVVGIVSYGSGCASEEPSLNINVNYYLNWIMNSLPDVKFCKARLI